MVDKKKLEAKKNQKEEISLEEDINWREREEGVYTHVMVNSGRNMFRHAPRASGFGGGRGR